MYTDSDPIFQMGDDSEIQDTGIGRIDLDDWYFNNPLFWPDLEASILLVYQMTHTGEEKRVTFTPETLEIVEISTNKMVALGFANPQTRMYTFSHFLPY